MSHSLAIEDKPVRLLKVFICLFLLFGSMNVAFAASDSGDEKAGVVKIVVFNGYSKDRKPLLSTGTGFVINEEGYIVTNHHVAGRAFLMFILKNGQRVGISDGFDVRNIWRGFNKNNEGQNTNIESRIWSSADFDLAVIKVRKESLAELNLKPATLTRSELKELRTVTAVGYPGIAEITIASTNDIKAQRTSTQGTVASVIAEGYWSGSRQVISQILHTAPISGGNSGGPLFDECGRVVGVNTAGPRSKQKVLVKRGNKVVESSITNDAYGLASNVNELISILDNQGIKYYLDNSPCISAQDHFMDENKKLTDTLQYSLYFGGAALLVIVLMLVYMMRSPTSRQRVGQAVETYSRSIRSPRPQPEGSSSAGSAQPTQRASSSNLILDGYSPDRQRYRFVIGSDDLCRSDVVIGREPGDGGYRVNDDSVSRRHCAFYAQGDKLFIRDMNSTNGTFVDGRRISDGERVSLNNGADIKLGSVHFKVISG